jgi:hypothetical protein
MKVSPQRVQPDERVGRRQLDDHSMASVGSELGRELEKVGDVVEDVVTDDDVSHGNPVGDVRPAAQEGFTPQAALGRRRGELPQHLCVGIDAAEVGGALRERQRRRARTRTDIEDRSRRVECFERSLV